MRKNRLRVSRRIVAVSAALWTVWVSAVEAFDAEALGAEEKAESAWDVSVGAGVALSPEYEGSDDMRVSPIPIVNVTWNDRIYLNVPEELGAHVYRGENLAAAVGVGYDFGRDDDSALDGLGDVDGAATLNLRLEYQVGRITSSIRGTRYLGSSDGLEVDLGVEALLPLRRGGDHPTPALSPAISATWADGNYTQAYFSVDGDQAARSGLERYDAGAGFKSVEGSVAFMYPLGSGWLANASLEYSRLIGDAADSPIVRDEDQFVAALIILHRF